MSRTKDVATTGGLTVGIILLFVALFVAIFVIGTAITSFFVWLIWNVFGLHAVFGLDALSFWGVVAVAAGINFVYSLFNRPSVTVS